MSCCKSHFRNSASCSDGAKITRELQSPQSLDRLGKRFCCSATKLHRSKGNPAASGEKIGPIGKVKSNGVVKRQTCAITLSPKILDVLLALHYGFYFLPPVGGMTIISTLVCSNLTPGLPGHNAEKASSVRERGFEIQGEGHGNSSLYEQAVYMVSFHILAQMSNMTIIYPKINLRLKLCSALLCCW